MRHDGSQVLDAVVLLTAVAIVAVGVALRADASARLLALTLGLAAVTALVLRRRAPTMTFVVSAGLVLALFAVDRRAGAIAVIAPAISLYSLSLVRGRVHLAVVVVAAAAAVVLADLFLGGHDAGGLTTQTAAHVALIAVPVLAAEALRNRRAYVQLLLERLALAERTREEEAERRAEQERLRIARELHDVVAHTLSTINVQAGVAAHLLGSETGHARDALVKIETASHEALDELRGILGVLREPGNGHVLLEPAPDLQALDALIEQTREAGMTIGFVVRGDPPESVPEAVQLAAFRIVQESLTNVRRHAPTAAASVTLAYQADGLRLEVENAAGAAARTSNGAHGVGVLGMRERATALGGTLEAGRLGTRYLVVAQLPYRRST